ncbi:MAG: prolyl oligopeptidase family serine peptidase [Hydrotalea sp.]|nr:prolyl oligopeptidase family serine peptidase [Hydrotalea sp.]
MKQILMVFVGFCLTFLGIAQDAFQYQQPPKLMAEMLLAKPTPAVSFDDKANWMLLSERNSYPSVEELGQPEARIAGMRINPNNFSLSRQTFINNFKLRRVNQENELQVKGLPTSLLASSVSWSPSQTKIAFLQNNADAVDLYVIDVATQTAKKINKRPLNTLMGGAYSWLDDNTLIYKTTLQPASAAPKRPITPMGPSIQENYGKAAPIRTYQDLMKTPYDEQLFSFMATAQLVMNKNGAETNIGKPNIYTTISASPDKQYLMIRTLRKPFSYLVPAQLFASTVSIIDLNGKELKKLADLPSGEGSPSGFDNVQNVPRSFDWRDDEAATITWCMPLDSGMIAKKAEFHDAVYALKAPFQGEATELFKTTMRFRGVSWGTSELALVMEGLTGKQVARMHRFNPSTGSLEMLMQRNTTDAYNNPGSPVTTKNQFGRQVLLLVDNGTKLLMNNTTGSSPNGDLPFLAKFDLQTKQQEIIWRCTPGQFEFISDVVDAKTMTFISRKETQTSTPNYFMKDLLKKIADRPITKFTNPYPQLEGITKEKIKYKRADGVDLTGDLYLPKGYNAAKDGPLPVFMWAYPREFNNAADAAQVRGSKDRFTNISWGSPIFWVTQGYAVLDNAEMPIVATSSDKKPNDNFIEQLKLNAEAAVQKLVDMGVGDKNRMAVGGHSYGAFMTAHLLSHTNLFKAGIARSGAYNRSLTPFGFQNEDRTYWQASQLYFDMSPFSYANKVKTPILLIHGEMDDNQGTFPIQSERYYSAIKGHGGTSRYVVLPYEAHGYRGRENVLHMLWEQHQWLEKYVKNAK